MRIRVDNFRLLRVERGWECLAVGTVIDDEQVIGSESASAACWLPVSALWKARRRLKRRLRKLRRKLRKQ